MDDKILKDRIPESELSNEFKRDGETLYGADLNRIVTVTKGGINYNAKLFESYLYGDDYRPFYHGNEVDWQDLPEYRAYGVVYWVRTMTDFNSYKDFHYITEMVFDEDSGTWRENGVVKIPTPEEMKEIRDRLDDIAEFGTPVDGVTIIRNENKEIMVSPELKIDGGFL